MLKPAADPVHICLALFTSGAVTSQGRLIRCTTLTAAILIAFCKLNVLTGNTIRTLTSHSAYQGGFAPGCFCKLYRAVIARTITFDGVHLSKPSKWTPERFCLLIIPALRCGKSKMLCALMNNLSRKMIWHLTIKSTNNKSSKRFFIRWRCLQAGA